MKTTFLILAGLAAVSTAAIAQDMPAGAQTQTNPPMTTPADPTMPEAGPAAGMPSQDTTMPSTPDTSTPTTAPDSSAMPPAQDPMAAGSPGMSTGMSSSAAVDTSNYPRCSRGVTDKCVQGGKAMRRRR